MRPLKSLKWLLAVVFLIVAGLVFRSGMSAGAETGSSQLGSGSEHIYMPLVRRDPTPTPTTAPTEPPNCLTHNAAYELELYDLINDARAVHGLPALIPNYSLETSAGRHSDDMALNHFVSHTGSDGSTVLSRTHDAGWTTNWVAEIIMHTTTPQKAMDWWMGEGPGGAHYDTILGNLTHFGAGYARCDGESSGYFTVDFGHQ